MCEQQQLFDLSPRDVNSTSSHQGNQVVILFLLLLFFFILVVNFYLAVTMMSKSVKFIRNLIMSFFSGGQILESPFQQSLLCLITVHNLEQ